MKMLATAPPPGHLTLPHILSGQVNMPDIGPTSLLPKKWSFKVVFGMLQYGHFTVLVSNIYSQYGYDNVAN